MTNKTDELPILLNKLAIEMMSEDSAIGAHYTEMTGGMYLIPASSLAPTTKEVSEEAKVRVRLTYEAVVDRAHSGYVDVDVRDIPKHYFDSEGGISDYALNDFFRESVENVGIHIEDIQEYDLDEFDFNLDYENEHSGEMSVEIVPALEEAREFLDMMSKSAVCPKVVVNGVSYVAVQAKAIDRSGKEEEALKIA